MWKTFGLAILGLAVVVLLVVVVSEGSIQWMKFFGVRTANAEREVSLHSRAFTKGMKDDILARMEEWRKADATGKAAIEFTVKQMCSEVDENTLPEEMASFVKRCKYGGNIQ